jgi:hypothetical protein
LLRRDLLSDPALRDNPEPDSAGISYSTCPFRRPKGDCWGQVGCLSERLGQKFGEKRNAQTEGQVRCCRPNSLTSVLLTFDLSLISSREFSSGGRATTKSSAKPREDSQTSRVPHYATTRTKRRSKAPYRHRLSTPSGIHAGGRSGCPVSLLSNLLRRRADHGCGRCARGYGRCRWAIGSCRRTTLDGRCRGWWRRLNLLSGTGPQ